MDQNLSQDIKQLVSSLLARRTVELVELKLGRERGRLLLRFLVDKPGGITLNECAQLNQEIGQILERENIVQESYVLEVSSPGLDRPLRSTRDFQRSLGKLVKIVLHQPINGKNVLQGLLEAVDEENVVIQTQKEQKLCIGRANIARANLEVKFG